MCLSKMKTYIFLTIYILVSLLTSSSSYHLKGVTRINGNLKRDIHNETVIPPVFKKIVSDPDGLDLNETACASARYSLENLRNETSSNSTEKASINTTETKISGEQNWSSLQFNTSKKASNLRDIISRPKRVSSNHRLSYKDWHKLAVPEKRLNRFDVIMVDVQPIYSQLRNKQQLHAYTSSSSHDVPMSPSTSIMDLFFGLNSFSPAFLTGSDKMDTDFYFKGDLLSPTWNRLLTYANVVNSDLFPEQDGYQNRKNVNVDKISAGKKNCTCGEK